MNNISYELGKPVSEIIKRRTSVRTYQKNALLQKDKDKLMTFANTIKGPFGYNVRFALLDISSQLNDNGIKLGTYGVIKGAQSFLAAAITNGNKAMEQLGYCFEKLILFAQSIDLETCWLGGTFKKGEFAKAVDLKDNEILPIVSPVGYKAASKSLTETIMRAGIGANKRKNWDELFYNQEFNKALIQQDAKEYELPLEMVRIAPSASNKQPWRIVKEESSFHFYLQHSKGYSKAFNFDIQKIDMGIAMCHFEMTAREVGLYGQWLEMDPKLAKILGDCEYIISWVELKS